MPGGGPKIRSKNCRFEPKYVPFADFGRYCTQACPQSKSLLKIDTGCGTRGVLAARDFSVQEHTRGFRSTMTNVGRGYAYLLHFLELQ